MEEEKYINRDIVYIGPRFATLMGHEGIPWPMARLEDKLYVLWRITEEMSDQENEVVEHNPERYVNGVAVDMEIFQQSSELVFLEDKLGVWMEEPVVRGDREEIPESFRRIFDNG